MLKTIILRRILFKVVIDLGSSSMANFSRLFRIFFLIVLILLIVFSEWQVHMSKSLDAVPFKPMTPQPRVNSADLHYISMEAMNRIVHKRLHHPDL